MQYSFGSGEDMKKNNIRLSAVVIAKNEGERIGTCLDALAFADEIIVVDNGSEDDTKRIAQSHGGSIISLHANNFAELRNTALKTAKGTWILYVDADELVSPELASALSRIVEKTESEHGAYEVFRKNYYLGYPWPAGEWMLRLFRKETIVGWEGTLHETPKVKGSIGRLSGQLLHDTHRTLEQMVDKTNEWSDIEADLRLSVHHPRVTWWRIIRVMLTGFWGSYVGQGGWRAGTVGWIESMYQGFSYFITYAKLWEKQQKNS